MAGGSKKKGGGGNSHDRSMDRASQPPVLHVPESLVPAQSISAPERISRLVDSGITQMLAGIVGGLVGTFLDGRYFAALSFMVSFALNRSKALIGIRHRWILPIHAVSVAIAFAALFFMGKQLNKSKPQVYTPEDYANAVRAKLPLPITRQVTNVYNSYVSPEKELGQPRVDLSEFTPYDQGSRNLSLKSFISNGGTVTAEDVVSSQLVLLRVRGKQSEDELFDTLEKDKFNSLAPREDIAPGPPNRQTEMIEVPNDYLRDQEYLSNRRVIYIGVIETYKDPSGKNYQTEKCEIMVYRFAPFLECDGHNFARRIKRLK